MTLTEYLDIPLTRTLTEAYGANLEKLTAQDKLEAAQIILTAIAWGDTLGTHKTIGDAYESFGAVYPNAPNTDQIAAFIDSSSSNTSIEDRIGLAAALCHQLYKGVYADAE